MPAHLGLIPINNCSCIVKVDSGQKWSCKPPDPIQGVPKTQYRTVHYRRESKVGLLPQPQRMGS